MDPRSIGDHTVISIHNNDISQVSSYKYLGVQIDKDMSWNTHVTSCCAKIHQRLHFLRRLRLFGVSVNIMLIFYRASIESILRYTVSPGADWPSGVQGKCPVGRSVLGPFGAFWGPTSAPKCPEMPFGALKCTKMT